MDGDGDRVRDAGARQVPSLNAQLCCGTGEVGRDDNSAPVRSKTGMKRSAFFLLLLFSCASPLQVEEVSNNPTRSVSVASTPSLRASHSRFLQGVEVGGTICR